MTVERAVRMLAGSLVLLSLVLSRWLGPWCLVLAAFVGLNLAQSSLTGFCPAEGVFRRLGLRGCGTASGSTRPSEVR